MKQRKTFYTADRQVWREWLEKHHATEKEIWLVYPKKASGRPRLVYNDAVEEALSFGWIDSIVRTIDESSYAQRFSPRSPRSRYSQANKERLRKLVKEGKVIPEVVAGLGNILEEKFVIAPDILKALRANAPAWKNFRQFTPGYRRIRIAFIEGARNRPEEFRKRLRYFISMTEKNKQFGFGGIKKYF
jgi:uncharacterized protein YdeI (YjbR/CyaY-like superfamily)